MNGKSKKNIETEAWVDAFTVKHGFPPTYRQVADRFKLADSVAWYRCSKFRGKMNPKKGAPLRYDTDMFTAPFRLGRKQKRAILDAEGKELLIMPHNSEKQAQMYVNYLNS